MKIAVYLASNVYIPSKYGGLCWQNIVMGDVQYYQKLLSLEPKKDWEVDL